MPQYGKVSIATISGIAAAERDAGHPTHTITVWSKRYKRYRVFTSKKFCDAVDKLSAESKNVEVRFRYFPTKNGNAMRIW
jgi:hypothetical protein